METKKYISSYNNALSQNRFLRLLILGLLAVIVVEGVLVFSLTKKVRIVVVPAVVQRKFYVEMDKASPDYIMMMAEYAVNLLNSYTPKTVMDRRKDFLQLISPPFYHEVSGKLLADARDIAEHDISSVFIRQDVKLLKGSRVAVVGVLKKWVGNQHVLTKQMAYIIGYRIHQGRFEVTSYEEMPAQDYYTHGAKSRS